VTEASWPTANVVIGNPPFLGGSKKRRELGDAYFDALGSVFSGRVPGGADLVCYWFDKARLAIEQGGLEATGLVATNSIRGGSNRKVLDAITKSTRIFNAWSDEGWVNEGAAVRVSLVCFGQGGGIALNSEPVPEIYADLSAPTTEGDLLDVSQARMLPNNLQTSFQGASKKAKFEIDAQLAREWLRLPNPHGLPNSDVLKPWANGFELSRGPQHQWIIDFGNALSEEEASLYERPFADVVARIKPERINKTDVALRDFWWRFGRPRVEMRTAFKPLHRFIATVAHSKHRFFVWLPVTTSPDQALITVARADDTTFGILHSRFHELWSLRMGTWLGVGNDPRYTPTTCFETFPFPAGLTPADTAHQRVEALPGGATIPADIYNENMPLALMKQGQVATNTILTSAAQAEPSSTSKARVVRRSGAISKSVAYEPPASEPAAPGESPQTVAHHSTSQRISKSSTQVKAPAPLGLRDHAISIAQAAKKLNDLREAWLNPPEWTHRVPEVIPLGLDHSPYPDRIEPRPGISEADLKALQKRTLTNLYNAKPAWLTLAHQHLDAAVAAAYGWADYSPALPDDEILKRLLALNLARST
jgi:hypothetical protein